MRITVASGSVPFLFLTPKSARGILVYDAVLHDLLRQVALDPTVSGIDYVRSVVLEERIHEMNCVLLVRSGFSEILDLGVNPRDLSERGQLLNRGEELECKRGTHH